MIIRNIFSGHIDENNNHRHQTIDILQDEIKVQDKRITDGTFHIEKRPGTLLSENNEPNFQSFKGATVDRDPLQTMSPRSTDERLLNREYLAELRSLVIQKDNEVKLLDYISARHSELLQSKDRNS
jgi:hypothetical protein